MLRFAFVISGLALSVAINLVAPDTAAANQLDRIKQRGKIIIGVKNDYPPFGYLEADGSLQGFDIVLAKAVAKHVTGSEESVEFVPVVASNRIELLNQGRIDVIIATLGRNDERAKVIDYTKDYYHLGGTIVISPKNTDIKAWEDLRGKKICGIQGNAANRELQEKFGADMALFQGTAEAYKAFQDNRCVGIAHDEPPLQQKLNDPAWKENYIVALSPREVFPLAAAVRKGERALLEVINEAIQSAEGADLLVEAEEKFGMAPSEFVAEQAKAGKAKSN